MLMYLAREYFWWTYEQIWDYFKMNHATAMYATDKIETALKNDSRLQHDYRVFSDWIQQ
jgi:chromosomal replication initiation ATPase DnaA